MLTKVSFTEQRADAEMQDSGDQIPHGHQELENGQLPGLARSVLREGVQTAEPQPGVGICCCPCWLAGELLDLFLAERDYQAACAKADAEAAEAAEDSPGQQQMGAGALPQTLAQMLQTRDAIREAVSQPSHPKAE